MNAVMDGLPIQRETVPYSPDINHLTEAEFAHLRNAVIGLHNLADVQPFGDFDASSDQAGGSHFIQKPLHNSLSPFELHITLETGNRPLTIMHHYPRTSNNGYVRHTLEYKFLPATSQITVTSSNQQYQDGIWGARPVDFCIEAYADSPLDANGVQEFTSILKEVQQQQGHLPKPLRRQRFVAWLMGPIINWRQDT